MTGFSPKVVRHVFFIRDKERCFRCQKRLQWQDRGIGWSMHHRRPRGMGGTSDPRVNGIANALTLCGSGVTGCHGWAEKYREIARDYGYLIPLNVSLDRFPPGGVRVKRQDGSWWLMTSAGLAVECEEGVAR